MRLRPTRPDDESASSEAEPSGGDDRSAHDLVCRVLETLPPIDRVVFASDHGACPALAYRVPFPRLGLVLNGRLTHLIGAGGTGATRIVQTPETALLVPGNGWNDPQWLAGEPVTTLDLLFDKQTLGFALTRWDGRRQTSLAKHAVPRRGPRTGAFVLQALGELIRRPEDTVTPPLLVRALIAHARDLMRLPSPASTHSAAFLQAIRDHIDAHCRSKLTREAVAAAFDITPNYLSHLFQKEIHIGFNGYLTRVRLERAKLLLEGYDLSIKEIADRCGYADGNYFCRVFRKATDRSPSEYRVHYHSRGGAPAEEL